MYHHNTSRDRGAILPIVLVLSVSMSLVVAAIAAYVTTGLRYGHVVESRADRLAAADGGLRYAVERLSLGAERICATSGGDTIDVPFDTNEATIDVTCSPADNGFNATSGWALILTGEELPVGEGLLNTLAGSSDDKEINGPVYMSRLEFGLGAPIKMVRGQLMYTSSDCSVTPSLPDPGDMSSGDGWLGVKCATLPWERTTPETDPADGLFREPLVAFPLPDSSGPVNPATYDINGCTVFVPGYYDSSMPSLGSNNYFMSGNYVLDGVTVHLANQQITAGRTPGLTGNGSAQFIHNPTCDDARNSDTNTGILEAGVTFYLQNGSRFEIGAGGHLEVLRRKQGKEYVSIHVLDDSLTWDQDVIQQQGGTGKDMAMHGLVWAPEARITFSLVTNAAKGQLLGGAVVSNIDLRSSAVGDGFVISVEPSDLHGKVEFNAVATLDGETTTIRSIVEYRPSTDYVAIKSWRVVE